MDIDNITTSMDKIFEIRSSFYVKYRKLETTGKLELLFFSSFFLVLIKLLFWEEDWA